MTISKEELRKLAKKGFNLCLSREEEERRRGYYALCFVFGSNQADNHVAKVVTRNMELIVDNEFLLLNSIND